MCFSACSASVFGVSPESMQCGYNDRGNSVPKILLLMQERQGQVLELLPAVLRKSVALPC